MSSAMFLSIAYPVDEPPNDLVGFAEPGSCREKWDASRALSASDYNFDLICGRPADHDDWHYDDVDRAAWRITAGRVPVFPE